MVSYKHAAIFCLLTSLALLASQPAAATATALVERQTVGINDSFSLVLTTDQGMTGSPDLSGLEQDFDILGSSKSSNVSIVNGNMARTETWVLELMARREGKLVIPAIAMGKETTAPIEISVVATTAGAPTSEVDLEIDVDNLSPYVQEQIIFTVRLVHKVQLVSASLTEPTVSGGNTVIEKLGDDVAYETTRGGTRVGIIERRYALFAQNSGEVLIEPLRFDGQVPTRGNFDPFRRGRSIRKRTDPIAIGVRPIPADYTGATWLPARQLMLVEDLPAGTTEYRAGEPFTRTLILQATGLSASQLPDIEVPVPADIKAYPDQPVLENRAVEEGVVGTRQEKIALIPAQPGLLTLPPVEIPWWNTRTGKQEYARLPARTIEVLPGALPAANAPGGNTVATPVATDPPAVATDEAGEQSLSDRAFWPWVSLALAIGWLATMLGWFWSRRQNRPATAGRIVQPDPKRLLAAIRKASDEDDAAACKEALLAWAGQQWPGSRIRSLGALAALLDGELQQQVHELSQCLYSRAGSGWDGKQFWQVFAARKIHPVARAHSSAPQLEPLYRQTAGQ